MKLPRPHIPLSVRVQVAERQFSGTVLWDTGEDGEKVKPPRDSEKLKLLLAAMFGNTKVELHHRPALCNRVWFYCDDKPAFCDPDANDPDYLIYLPADEHDVETRVRGQHGDYSDLAKARKRKRKERLTRKQVVADWYTIAPRYRTKERLTKMLADHGLSYKPAFKKRKLPSRPLRSASRWPKKRISR